MGAPRTKRRTGTCRVVACCAALMLAGGTGAADPVRWSLTLEGGSEYDTNIHRFESFDEDIIVAAPLLRGATRLHLGWSPRPAHTVLATVLGGAKLFAGDSGQDENRGMVAADGRYQWRLPGRSAVLGVHGSYHDTFGYELFRAAPGQVSQRNFAVAGGELALDLAGPEGQRLTLTGGYRHFRYDPDAAFDWQGEHAGARYQTSRWLGDGEQASLDLAASYGVERRAHASPALRDIACPDGAEPSLLCTLPLDQTRTDLHHVATAEAVYTGERIYSARYEAQITDSNSYGQSVVRQRLELGITTELLARVFATARGTLQIDTYLDSLLLARDVLYQTPDPTDLVAIDAENRSAASLHLARDLGSAWSMEARYALFLGALAGEGARFRRQLFYLGMVYRYAP